MRLPSAIKCLSLLFALSMTLAATPIPARASLSIEIAVAFGPPAIPFYYQPPCPDPNWIWEPGYWAWDPADASYYWVPGTWVPAPEYGLYWTPGYWAWDDGNYVWYQGYWASEVGYYGGIDYGYGYYGNGYVGGSWHGRQFAYNTAVTNVNRHAIHSLYSSRAGVASTWRRVSYNGGRGGVNARPTRSQLAVQHMHRIGPTSVQLRHEHVAMATRANFASVNHGRPKIAAVARPMTAPNRSTSQHHVAVNQQHRAVASHQQHRAVANQSQHHAAAVQHAMTQHHAATQHAYHQPAAQTHHAAAQTYHAPAQAYYRAAAQTYHAPAQTYHAPAQAYRAPAQAYHPAQTYHAPARMAAPRQVARPAGPQGGGRPAAPQGGNPNRRPGL